MEDLMFIFIIALINDKREVRVVDINYDCLHEKFEYVTIDDDDYLDVEEAILKAKKYAKEQGLRYQPFSARHCNHISFKE